MVISSKWLFIYVVLAITLISTGCTHNYAIRDVPLRDQGREFVVDKKIDFTVNLCLSDELRAAKWERQHMGDTFVMPIGEQLSKNASELSDILFRKAVVTNAPVPAGTNQTDAILTPRVVSIEKNIGSSMFSTEKFTVVLEWKLEDRQGNLIWLESIQGKGEARAGKYEEQGAELLKDLFAKSLQAIRTSPEISQFETQNRMKLGATN